MRRVVALLVVCLVLDAGCATAPAPRAAAPDATGVAGAARPKVATLSPAEEALLEAGFRHVLKHQKNDEPIFISATPYASYAVDRNQLVDPPASLLAKLADLKLDLKPASAAEDRGFNGIIDGATGKQGRLYWVEVEERVSDTRVRLKMQSSNGPFVAGESMMFELKDGEWVPTGLPKLWVS